MIVIERNRDTDGTGIPDTVVSGSAESGEHQERQIQENGYGKTAELLA